MAYRNFRFKDLREKFQVKQSKQSLFGPHIVEVNASSRLVADISEARTMALTSEKALSEGYVFPILKELRRCNIDSIEIFSGENLDVDIAKGLNGECDFIVTKSPGSVEVSEPIICVTEAKKGVVDDSRSLAQTAAQLLGAQMFNANAQKPISPLYGACTNGTEWLFLKLEDNHIYVDTDRYVVSNINQLLGVLQYIVDTAR